MPHFIMKPVAERDFYIDWSTIVDRPILWGSRAELQRALDPDSNGSDRFDRADRTGTSSFIGDGAWDETEFWLREIGQHAIYVQRSDLEAFCASINDDDPERPYDTALVRIDCDWED